MRIIQRQFSTTNWQTDRKTTWIKFKKFKWTIFAITMWIKLRVKIEPKIKVNIRVKLYVKNQIQNLTIFLSKTAQNLSKISNFHENYTKTIQKTPNSTEIGAVDNSVLPKCGVEVLIVLLYFFCRNCFFVSHFFVI